MPELRYISDTTCKNGGRGGKAFVPLRKPSLLRFHVLQSRVRFYESGRLALLASLEASVGLQVEYKSAVRAGKRIVILSGHSSLVLTRLCMTI